MRLVGAGADAEGLGDIGPWRMLEQAVPGRRASPVARPDLSAADDTVPRCFDRLRTSLLRTLKAHGLNRVAVAAPTRGCGTTFSALNLAYSLSRVPGCRTLLLDLNLRRPGLAKALDLNKRGDMRGLLSGRVHPLDNILRLTPTLAVGLANWPQADASDLLQSESCAVAVGRLMDTLSPDVLICDLPPLLEQEDLSAFLPQVDGVLLVADGTQTLPDHISSSEAVLAGQTRILGVVLNQARQSRPMPTHA